MVEWNTLPMDYGKRIHTMGDLSYDIITLHNMESSDEVVLNYCEMYLLQRHGIKLFRIDEVNHVHLIQWLQS